MARRNKLIETEEWLSEARELIIEGVPIEQYIEDYDVGEIGREGKMLCPLHDESTPSCFVDTDKQRFNCFGCGKGGSVVELHRGIRLRVTDRYSQVKAIRDLAARYEIELPYKQSISDLKGKKVSKISRSEIRKRELSEKEQEMIIHKVNRSLKQFPKKRMMQAMVIGDKYIESEWDVPQAFRAMVKVGLVNEKGKILY